MVVRRRSVTKLLPEKETPSKTNSKEEAKREARDKIKAAIETRSSRRKDSKTTQIPEPGQSNCGSTPSIQKFGKYSSIFI